MSTNNDAGSLDSPHVSAQLTAELALPPIHLQVHGEQTLCWIFAKEASTESVAQVQFAARLIRAHAGDWLIDLIPAATTLLIVFNFLKYDADEVYQSIAAIWPQKMASPEQQGKLVTLPCFYDERFGPDLARIALLRHLSIAEVIHLHSKQRYQVHAIGFAPGFAYLGHVETAIASPRLSTPRTKVPAGSVGIAGSQTAVYPKSSPGGWNIIGNCPLPMFSLTASPMMPVEVGDWVQFAAIERAEFLRLGGNDEAWRAFEPQVAIGKTSSDYG